MLFLSRLLSGARAGWVNRCVLSIGGVAFLAAATGVQAANDLWTGAAFGSAGWSNTLNWVPSAPNTGDDVIFGASGQTGTQVDMAYTVGSITFAPGAPAYTLSVALGASLTLSRTGLANNSNSAQTIDAAGSDGVTDPGSVLFEGSATAGNVAFVNHPSTLYGSDGSFTRFANTSSAANATFVNGGPTATNARGANVTFQDSATAGSAVISNGGGNANRLKGGNVSFLNSATAASSIIINNGALAAGALGGFISFFDNTTAGNATITCNGTDQFRGDGGQVYFVGSSSAGSASLIANGGLAVNGDGGYFAFNNNSTAGNATITCNGSAVAGVDGGYVYFFGAASGGTARAIINAGGFFDVSPSTQTNGFSIGSIEGAGTFYLGSVTLNAGLNNLSTTVSGSLVDGGYTYGTAGGGLNKVGAGTLTLSGASTYTGVTVVGAGSLIVTGSLPATKSVTVMGGTTLALGGTGTIGQAATTVVINANGTLTGGGTVNGNVTNNGLVTVDGSTLTLTGSVVNNGTLRLTSGAQLNAAGTSSFVNNGVVDVLGGAASLPPNFVNGASGVVVDAVVERVRSVSRAGGVITLSVNGYTGHTYQLQRADAVGGPYTNVEAAQSGSTGGVVTFTHQESDGARQGFYHVLIDPSRAVGSNGLEKVGGARLNPVYPGKVRRQPAE